jgi:hypothetical protein
MVTLRLLLFILIANEFLHGGSGINKTQQTNNTHHKKKGHDQTKHSTKNYTHNRRHTTQNEYKQSQLQLYKLIVIKNTHAIQYTYTVGFIVLLTYLLS